MSLDQGRCSGEIDPKGNAMTHKTASGPEPLRDRIAALLSGAAVLLAVLAWPFIGNLAAYLSLGAFLPAVLIGFRLADCRRLISSSWIWLFLTGFALLSGSFVLQPDQASIASIGDFAIFAVAPAIGLAVAPLARTRFALNHLAFLGLVAAVLAAAIGAYGLAQGLNRVTAPNLSPIHFADFAMILGFMGLGLTLTAGSRWRWLALAGPVLGVVASVAAGTRSALLVGCALAALYALFLMQRFALPLWQKIALPVFMVAVVILVFYLAHLAGHTRAFEAVHAIWGALTGDLTGDSSTAYRIDMLRAGWRAFLDQPLVGHGWHQQLQAAMPYLPEDALRGYAREEWGYIHNEPLSLAVAAGLPGVLAYCLFFAAPFAALGARPVAAVSPLATFLATSFAVGLVISGMTDVLFMVEITKVLLVLVAACLFWLKEAPERHANG